MRSFRLRAVCSAPRWESRRAVSVLVYGANTDVGKTVASAALMRAAASQSMLPSYVKPVQTGAVKDAATVLRMCQESFATTLHQYPSPESPHTAAAKAGVAPVPDATLASEVRDAVRDYVRPDGVLRIVETAGGPLSPGPSGTAQADIYASLELPVVLVGDPKLGGISTTLSAYESLTSRGQEPSVVVFLEASGEGAAPNAAAVRERVSAAVVAVPELPPQPEPLTSWLSEPAVEEGFAAVLDRCRSSRAADHSVDTDFDRSHMWHPYTSMSKPGRVWAVDRAEGSRLQLSDGRWLVDGMASWWCAVHGYRVPELDAAARRQLQRMSHVMFGGLTHRPAVELGRLLVDVAPAGIQHVFLCDSGSVSVEVALKMAVQYWAMKGKPEKCRIATVRRGYHGDTFGAMSVCDPERGMHSLFSGTLPKHLFADEPAAAVGSVGDEAADDGFGSMDALLRAHHHETAAVIIEPIVQGAGGMRFYPASYLRKLRATCSELGVLLIFDEIATGFGRTGKLFAAEHAGVSPDVMCIGKALTGGYCTLGATLATADVADGVSGGGTQPMMHGPTFMGNPLACAIAHASVELLLSSDWSARVRNIERRLRDGLQRLVGDPRVRNVRVLGAIGVVELKEPPADPAALQAAFVDSGVWLRPFGTNVYTMPPFTAADNEVQAIADAMVSVVKSGVGLSEPR